MGGTEKNRMKKSAIGHMPIAFLFHIKCFHIIQSQCSKLTIFIIAGTATININIIGLHDIRFIMKDFILSMIISRYRMAGNKNFIL